MINKLRTKISLIILLAISIPLCLVVTFYTYSYYNNTVRVNSHFVERFFKEPKGGPDIKKDGMPDISEADGIYSVSVIAGKIDSSSDNVTSKIKKYALKLASEDTEDGIIGNYIYSKRGHKNSEITIIFIESSSEISKVKIVIISSIFLLAFGIVIIYILSKRIANIIVRPVEDTFTKQIDFISDASHELKTPLAVIRANADVLEGEIGNNKWLYYIQNETDNMSKLINELLLLSKIENIDSLRQPEKFNMSEHIELVVATFESMAYEKQVMIETKIQKDIVTLNFNRDDIEHILSTLLDNAIKHTKEKKKVLVEFEKNKDAINIAVWNQGEEIPIEERSKIFDRFYRIDKSRNRNEKRYGLGLSIARSTVLKNKGTITVDYIDGYTVFKVKLPL